MGSRSRKGIDKRLKALHRVVKSLDDCQTYTHEGLVALTNEVNGPDGLFEQLESVAMRFKGFGTCSVCDEVKQDGFCDNCGDVTATNPSIAQCLRETFQRQAAMAVTVSRMQSQLEGLLEEAD